MITTAYNEGITGVRTSKTLVIEKDNDKASGAFPAKCCARRRGRPACLACILRA